MSILKVTAEESRRLISLLPHRYPFLLIDRIEEYEPERRIVGIKNVTHNEPYFAGHYPNFPIMPGVLIIEAMVQTGGILAMETAKGSLDSVLPVFTRIEKARFRRPVRPGDQLRMEVGVMKRRHPIWWFEGRAYVNGELATEAQVQASMNNNRNGANS